MHQIVSKMMFLFLAPPTGNGTFLRRSPPVSIGIKHPVVVGNYSHLNFLMCVWRLLRLIDNPWWCNNQTKIATTKTFVTELNLRQTRTKLNSIGSTYLRQWLIATLWSNKTLHRTVFATIKKTTTLLLNIEPNKKLEVWVWGSYNQFVIIMQITKDVFDHLRIKNDVAE